jgi:prepilin-type N-terminal cleavage/methylation domain-containing protein
MTPPGRKPLHGEDGFALIEVLVSALILAIVAAGVLSLLSATTRSSAAERNHSQAYALAQEDQARLRSVRLSSLNRLKQSNEYTLGGTKFTVESTGVFVNNTKGQPSTCSGAETSADYVRITSSVTWPRSLAPVVIQSIVSPSTGSLDPNHGTLIVTVKNAAAKGISGVGLSGSGAGTFNGTTDSEGCANFTDLPAGNYTVTPTGTGLVGRDGEPPHAVSQGVVAAGNVTLALEYDTPATVPAEFLARIGSGLTFEAVKVDSLFVFNSLGAKAYWTPTKARESLIKATPVFPFGNQVSIWAGSCESNNPGTGAGQINIILKPGEEVKPTLKLQVPALQLTVKNGSSLVSGARITITDESCKDEKGVAIKRTYTSEASGHQSSTTSGTPEYGLPWGTYKICASATFIESSKAVIHRIEQSGVSVKSLSSATSKTLDLSGSGWESGKACP